MKLKLTKQECVVAASVLTSVKTYYLKEKKKFYLDFQKNKNTRAAGLTVALVFYRVYDRVIKKGGI